MNVHSNASPLLLVPMSKVESLFVAYTPDDDERPVIQAQGSVPSGGWSNPQLLPASNQVEAGGVFELELVAQEPAPGSFFVVTHIERLTAVLVGVPPWAREVRVVSKTNSQSYMLEQDRPLPSFVKRAYQAPSPAVMA